MDPAHLGRRAAVRDELLKVRTSLRVPACQSPSQCPIIRVFALFITPTNKPRTIPLHIHIGRFVPGLRRANITIDRKVLADLAVTEPYSFKAVVDTVRSAAAP